MALFVVAWAVCYAARMLNVPADIARTPTYAHQSGLTHKAYQFES